MSQPKNLLIVDDEAKQRGLISNFLISRGYSCDQAADARQALDILGKKSAHMVIMDVRMPGMTGLEALREIRKNSPLLPVLLITAYADVRDAVAAIKDGALDYLAKPIDLAELAIAVEDAIGTAESAPPPEVELPKNVIAKSRAMLSLFAELAIVAPSTASILITGESGTGKEVIASLTHAWSERKDHPLVNVNCAAIPENLMESELFGHEKGAFTGAVQSRDGYFKTADGGTLFLDEIAEMSLNLQAKLLRVIQDGTFHRLGSNRPIHSDVRLIAATNHDLEQAIRDGRFREDLFYRLNVIHLTLPPLRERQVDILPLARHFARQFSADKMRFSRAAETALELYQWPGNVRELRNVVERACLLSRGEIILPEQLPGKISAMATQKENEREKEESGTRMEDVERETILKALEEANGNRTLAAKKLGISRRNLLYKLQRYKEEGHIG